MRLESLQILQTDTGDVSWVKTLNHRHCISGEHRSLANIWFWLKGQYWQIEQRRKREWRPCWDTKTIFPYVAPQKKTKTIFGSHSIYSSCYTSESCHQHFLDINQCQDQRGEEEERLRSRALLNLTKSNTWIVVVLAAWGHGGGLQASRRHLKFSAVVGYSLSPHGTHFWLQSFSVRAFPAVRRCLNYYVGN